MQKVCTVTFHIATSVAISPNLSQFKICRDMAVWEKSHCGLSLSRPLFFFYFIRPVDFSLVHNMTQFVARPRDAMRRHAKICQHGDITLRSISSCCNKSYDVAQNRKKSILSDNRTTSQCVASHHRALRRLASYCELGFSHQLGWSGFDRTILKDGAKAGAEGGEGKV